jgi:hypothetical protein
LIIGRLEPARDLEIHALKAVAGAANGRIGCHDECATANLLPRRIASRECAIEVTRD